MTIKYLGIILLIVLIMITGCVSREEIEKIRVNETGKTYYVGVDLENNKVVDIG